MLIGLITVRLLRWPLIGRPKKLVLLTC